MEARRRAPAAVPRVDRLSAAELAQPEQRPGRDDVDVALQRVVARHRRRPRRRYDRPGRRPPRRAAQGVAFALDHEQRHVHRGELGRAGLLGPARRVQREGQREDAGRTLSGRRPAGHRGAGAAAAEHERALESAVVAEPVEHDPPDLVQPRRCGRDLRLPATRHGCSTRTTRQPAPATSAVTATRSTDSTPPPAPWPRTSVPRTAPSASVVCVRAGPSGVSCSSMRVMYPTAGPGVRRPRRSGQVP